MKVSLRDIAHIRTGDKGSLSTVSVTCHEPAHYPVLADQLSSELAATCLGPRIRGRLVRYELPRQATILFVCPRDPKDTVNTSLYLDRHGKTLGSSLYDIELDIDR